MNLNYIRHETEAKILSFRNLRNGWHYGEGVELAESDLESAIALHSKIIGAGFTRTDAFPGLDGEVRVTIYQGKKYAEFTLEKHGKWTFVLEVEGEEKEYTEFLTFEKIVSKIMLLNDICHITFEYFHEPIGTAAKSVIRVWHSGPPPTMDAFRYLIENVPSEPMAQFATISKPSIRLWQENRQYFGNSHQQFSRKELEYSIAPQKSTNVIPTLQD